VDPDAADAAEDASRVTGRSRSQAWHSQTWNQRVGSAARLNGCGRVGVAGKRCATRGCPRGKTRMCCHSGVSGGSVLARVRVLRRAGCRCRFGIFGASPCQC